ncbi:hypothetical protein GHT06_013834 [Daphnia sinensis]|uniref:Cuticle protein n=1 Tax=Daphnia sinensis TaxID=1820382 RepID=A0AAD5KSS7_9CRUS|nr:hypothetical protein GHT06_013834 [Daphnia sinensis]
MQFFVLAALIAVAAASPVYPGQAYPTTSYNKPSYSGSTYETYAPQPYSFNWAVYDGYGNDYSHTESSDGKVTTGNYRVLLPDGRVQIVNYKADDYGYNADVKYEGEAQYPVASYSAPAYSAPAYSAPAYNSRAVIAPAVSSRTYSAPAYTAPAVISRTYSAPVSTSTVYTSPVVPAPARPAMPSIVPDDGPIYRESVDGARDY